METLFWIYDNLPFRAHSAHLSPSISLQSLCFAPSNRISSSVKWHGVQEGEAEAGGWRGRSPDFSHRLGFCARFPWAFYRLGWEGSESMATLKNELGICVT